MNICFHLGYEDENRQSTPALTLKCVFRQAHDTTCNVIVMTLRVRAGDSRSSLLDHRSPLLLLVGGWAGQLGVSKHPIMTGNLKTCEGEQDSVSVSKY